MFHEYFYNGEVELRLSYLTVMKQKYGENVSKYLKQFRGTRNRCYNLTIGEKDLAHLAFSGLSLYLREKMEGQDFIDVNKCSNGQRYTKIILETSGLTADLGIAMLGTKKSKV
jgi:hypothetical protein